MMALKGQRVLLADFDPQCNLNGMVMGFKGVDDLAAIYKRDPPNNVKDGLAPAFESQPRGILAVKTVPVGGNDNLFLLPGHIGLAEYETTLGIAQELSRSLLALRNLPGAIRFLLDETAAASKADYILIDISPSLGPLTKQLPTGVGRFIRVALNILKYDVISDVTTGRAEISSGPKSPPPITLAELRLKPVSV